MALHSDANDLKVFIFQNPEVLKDPMFILAHAPLCAKHMSDNETGSIYKECLRKMFEAHPYTIPFYYIGYLMNTTQWCSAKTCKSYLRDVCSDIARLIPWFHRQGLPDESDPTFLKIVYSSMTDYIKKFISNVRTQQLSTGANESVLANYAPIIPYSINLEKDPQIKSLAQETSEYLDQHIIRVYKNVYENVVNASPVLQKDAYLSSIALNNTKAIIENIDTMFTWFNPMDVFEDLSKCRYNNDTYSYLALVWLMNRDTLITPEDLDKQFTDYATFRNHFMNPLKHDQFKQVFESMCSYPTGNIKDMMTVEAWSALQEDSQEFANKFLEHATKIQPNDIYDLDALLAEFYTMRHVETNDYTNQFFLCEYPGIKVTNYTYINDTILVCEINDKYLAIPYVDIAADYNVHMITIDKQHNTHIWNDEEMSQFTIPQK